MHEIFNTHDTDVQIQYCHLFSKSTAFMETLCLELLFAYYTYNDKTLKTNKVIVGIKYNTTLMLANLLTLQINNILFFLLLFLTSFFLSFSCSFFSFPFFSLLDVFFSFSEFFALHTVGVNLT